MRLGMRFGEGERQIHRYARRAHAALRAVHGDRAAGFRFGVSAPHQAIKRCRQVLRIGRVHQKFCDARSHRAQNQLWIGLSRRTYHDSATTPRLALQRGEIYGADALQWNHDQVEGLGAKTRRRVSNTERRLRWSETEAL